MHLWRGCSLRPTRHARRLLPAQTFPSGHVMPVAASHLHAGNHFRKLGSAVKIDAAQDVQDEWRNARIHVPVPSRRRDCGRARNMERASDATTGRRVSTNKRWTSVPFTYTRERLFQAPRLMRLRKIRLAGFKSFVEPTTLEFPGDIVGIVGPNGCGKSNVIDAVRWVMGEISARSLRGDTMADVVFNGSRSRKPVSRASVELVFDNLDGRAGRALRRVQRDCGTPPDRARRAVVLLAQRDAVPASRRDGRVPRHGARASQLRDYRAGDDRAHHRGEA